VGRLSRRSCQRRNPQVPLRISLHLDASDPSIHSLAWETLHDPERGGFVFQSERVWLSRVLDSPDLTQSLPAHEGRYMRW
jgi:hypothetical protein